MRWARGDEDSDGVSAAGTFRDSLATPLAEMVSTAPMDTRAGLGEPTAGGGSKAAGAARVAEAVDGVDAAGVAGDDVGVGTAVGVDFEDAAGAGEVVAKGRGDFGDTGIGASVADADAGASVTLAVVFSLDDFRFRVDTLP